MEYGFGADFAFREASRFLKKKKPLTKEEYLLLDEECRVKAFTVSGYITVEVLQGFLDTLEQACENGQTKEQFREQMNRFLEEQGYKGLNPWKSDTIFRNNIQAAFNAGHYKSMMEPQTKRLRPYFKYVTAGDGKVRDTHQVMEGKIYSATDPIWDIWYPPNGHRCRCMVVSLTKGQVERQGLTIEQNLPYCVDQQTGEMKPAFPDKGFSNNPAKDDWKPDLSKLSPPVKKIYKERQERQMVKD